MGLSVQLGAAQEGEHLPEAPLSQNPGAPICVLAHFYAVPVLHGSCSSNTRRFFGEEKYHIPQAVDRRTCKSNGLRHWGRRLTPVEVIPCRNKDACRDRTSLRSGRGLYWEPGSCVETWR